MDFKNKVVIVTGGSCGIGAEIAVQFAKKSATIVIVGRNEEKLNAVATECGKYGTEPLAIKADLTIDSDVQSIVEQTIERFGRIDILINNAGIVGTTKIEDGVSDYDKIFNINLRGVYLLTSTAVPYLIETKGNIINISSAAAFKIFPTITVYCMSKAALDMFTKGLAVELADKGVRANAINPGPVKTDIWSHAGAGASYTSELWTWSQISEHTLYRLDNRGVVQIFVTTSTAPIYIYDGNMDAYASTTLLGKYSLCKEIADMALYLASDKAGSITGSSFLVDNGMVLK